MKYKFLFLLLLLVLPLLSALPTPTIVNTTEWTITQDTESDYFGYVGEKNKQQTEICVLSETATKLNDLPQHFTYTNLETNETEQLNRKKVTIEEEDFYGFCRNFHTEKKIKFGDNSIIYEWQNSTLYIYETDLLDLDPFEIEILCNDVKLTTPDISFVSEAPIEEGIKFSASLDNFTCDGKLTFRQNKLVTEIPIWSNQFGSESQISQISYADFESSEENNITSQNITTELPEGWDGWYYCVAKSPLNPLDWYSCMNEPRYYNLNYYGTFTDLDPSLTKTITSSSQLIYTNKTEATNLGARNLAPILNMEFNSAPEGTYVKDDGIYGNYGVNSGSTWGATSGYGGTGGFSFDGVNDYINFTSAVIPLGEKTVSLWFKTTDGDTMATISNTYGYPAGNGFFIRTYSSGSLGAGIRQSGTNILGFGGSGSVNDGGWHLATFTWDGTTATNGAKMYLDGNILAEATATAKETTSATYNLVIGSFGDSSAFFNGSIDNVQIYDKALTSDQVLDIYNNQSGKYFKQGDFKSLVFYNSTSTYWNTTLSLADSDGSAEVYDLCQADANCVSYWDLDTGNSDANPYNDEKGSNDGTPTGTNNATGISSGAMRFDGSGDFITFTNSVGVQSKSEYSLSMWAYLEDGVKRTLWDDYTQPTDYFRFSITNSYNTANKLTLHWRTSDFGTRYTLEPSVNTPTNEWVLITVSYSVSGNYAKIYFNGEEVATTSSNIGAFTSTASPKVILGADEASTPADFNGSIDEVLIYNKSLTASEVEDLYKAGLSQHANTNVTLETRTASDYNLSDSGLVSLWGLNENYNGSSQITDEFGIVGTVNGNPVWGESAGLVGGGFDFDGSGDYISTSITSAAASGAVSMWIKPEGSFGGNSDRLFYTSSANRVEMMYDYSNTQKLVITVDNGGWTYVTGNKTDWNDGQWYFVTFMWSGNVLYIYVDGVLDNSGADVHGTINFGTVNFGGRSGLGCFNGDIDEVRVYNRSLSQSEIQNLYELGSYHIEWNDWEDLNETTDGVPQTTLSGGNFMQFRPTLQTDDTDVSAYVLNYSVSPAEGPITNSPPYFTFIPDNMSIECGVDTLGVNFTAIDDDANFDSYAVNDTGFAINQTGWLSRIDAPVGNYVLNISINDTEGESNSTLWYINITDTTNPTWSNNLTNITSMSAGESVYFNVTLTDLCAGGYYIFSWFNGTDWVNDSAVTWTSGEELEVIKLIEVGASPINWTWYFNDSIGNWNQTDVWSQTIEAIPVVSINYPSNGQTYTSVFYDLNYTLISDTPDKCWYSKDGGITNSTTVTAGNNWTNILGTEGNKSWTVYCNNTFGNIGFDTTNFTIDYPPLINILNPTEGSTTSLVFNFTMSCTDTQGISLIWYNWAGANYTYINSLDLIHSGGHPSIIGYCNDTHGSVSKVTRTWYTVDFDSGNDCDYLGEGYYRGSDGICHPIDLEQTCDSGYVQNGYYSNGTIICVAQSGGGSTTLAICRYKKLGYYNENLPWLKEGSCV